VSAQPVAPSHRRHKAPQVMFGNLLARPPVYWPASAWGRWTGTQEASINP